MTDVNVWLSKTTKRVNRWVLQHHHSSSTILRSQLVWPLVFTAEYLRQDHIYPCDWRNQRLDLVPCSVHLMHLYIFNFHSRTFTSVLLLYACASVMHLSASSHYGGPGVISERRHSDPAMGRADTVTGQVYTPTPLQNVNYLIRFAETASGRRKRVRGPVCGTRTSVRGSRRGRFWSVAPYRAVWSLILAADFALGRNSMWRGWEQNWTVLFSPPLFLSSTVLSLSFTLSLHSTICKCCRCTVERKTWAVFEKTVLWEGSFQG